MKYKGILLDIDNTLYDYRYAHTHALDEVIKYCHNKFDLQEDDILQLYNTAKIKVKYQLKQSASSHNRLLYIQTMLEALGLNSLKYSLDCYELYWSTFLNHIEVYDGVYDFLQKYKNKICFISDLTVHIQHRKIHKMELFDAYVVTSEEAGVEKPHPDIFNIALGKLGLGVKDVCMIGDDFAKDIVGATNLGIKSIWLNTNKKIEKFDSNLVIEVTSFKDILDKGIL